MPDRNNDKDEVKQDDLSDGNPQIDSLLSECDTVTIGLYREEKTYSIDGLEDTLNEVKKITEGFIKAASASEKSKEIKIFLSVLLVPNWEALYNNHYMHEEYQRNKCKFMLDVENIIISKNIKVTVQNFYEKGNLSQSEKDYMHQLKSMGSNLDMIKFRAIINNLSRKHLQIDSNTVVHSYCNLYNDTFGAEHQKDGINASYYNKEYVSAHSKMVYTIPNGIIADQSNLCKRLREWCETNKNNSHFKGKDSNCIYFSVFAESLVEIGLVKKYVKYNNTTIYVASLYFSDFYRLSNFMTTAVSESWKSQSVDIREKSNKLAKLPFVKIGDDGNFNYDCFKSVIQKNIGDLTLHDDAMGLCHEPKDTGSRSRKKLFQLCPNSTFLEKKAVKDFFNHNVHLYNLCELFPNTKEADVFIKSVFNYTLEQLKSAASFAIAASSAAADSDAFSASAAGSAIATADSDASSAASASAAAASSSSVIAPVAAATAVAAVDKSEFSDAHYDDKKRSEKLSMNFQKDKSSSNKKYFTGIFYSSDVDQKKNLSETTSTKNCCVLF